MLDEVKKLLNRINEAVKIYHSDVDWEVKYDLIFGMNIISDVRKLNLSFDYYDPDTSYEEDITAYMNALIGLRDRLNALVGMGEPKAKGIEQATICYECDKQICKSDKPCGFVGCPFPLSWWDRT